MAAKADQSGGVFGGGSQHAVASDECTPARARDAMLGAAEWAAGETTALSVSTASIPPRGIERRIRYRTEHTETEGQQIWVEGQWVDGEWVPGYYRTASTSTTYPTLIGLTPWQRYQLTVTLESRPVDEAGTPTGDWAASGTRTHYILADITGEGGFDWQIIESTAGHETRIASTLLEVA